MIERRMINKMIGANHVDPSLFFFHENGCRAFLGVASSGVFRWGGKGENLWSSLIFQNRSAGIGTLSLLLSV